MDKKLIIVLGVFLTVALCVAALYSGDSNHEEIPFKSIDDPDVQSQVLESIMENSDLVLTIETTDSVTIKPATVRHSVSYNAGITTVTIFDYIGQKFHVVVGDSSDVYLFGVTDKKEYDKENKTVTIINDTSKKPKMTIKLLSSESDICTFTEIFEVTNFEMYTPDSDLDFKARSVVQKGGNSVFKTEWFIEVNQSYVVNITDYKATQVEKEVYNNKTGKNETIFVNETVISGYPDETHYRNVWSDYNKYGTKLAKNTIQKIKVVYHKKAELGDVRIQTVPVFAGVECEELTWWNTSWNCRRNITIDHTKVAADETNFPVMVSINQTGLNTDGNDIRITDSSGNQVAREIECYNQASGDLVFFFNGTSISNTSDTSFWVYYNNSAATEPAVDSTYGSQAVWDSNYVYVSHMADLTTSTIKDSTANGRSSIKLSANNPIEYNAEYGKSQDFSSDHISIPDSADFDFTDFTFESYYYKDADASGAIMSKFYDGSTRSWEFYDSFTSDRMDCYVNAAGTPHVTSGDNSVPIQNWYYTAVRHDDNSTSQWYIDGAASGSAVDIGAVNANAASVKIGDRVHASSRIYFNGKIAEVRLSNILRSVGYVATTSNNMHNPTATGTAPFFASFGAEESGIITEYTPATPLDKNGGESQLFTVNTSENSQCRWYINGSLMQTNSIGATRHEYLNSSLDEGYWNFTAIANTTGMTSSQTWWVNVSSSATYKPPEPTNLQHTTGNFWINHTWQAGSGNVTDGWNVSVNSVWHNRTYAWYNETYSPHAWQNISVWAWNSSGVGTLSD